MYIVTGGAGFIGSNIIKGLNQSGISDILVVDNLQKSEKFKNLTSLQFADYRDKETFIRAIRKENVPNDISAIFHQGACSDTMEYDGRYMMDNNYEYSKALLHFALERRVPFIYASSAAVYGTSQVFTEAAINEKPLNIYGYSKLLFDRYVSRIFPEVESTIVGLRYFNVYGPGEDHKGRMASMVHQLCRQLQTTGKARLFRGTGGYGDGEQRRDFVSVDDIVAINLHFAKGPMQKGVYNVGTGQCRSFNDVARNCIDQLGIGEIEYVDMPATLMDKYQNYTQADISRLREAGFCDEMTSLEKGIARFVGGLRGDDQSGLEVRLA